MFHVRKVLTRREIEEHDRWKAKHDAEIEVNKLSKAELEKKTKKFWDDRSKLISQRLAGYRDAPSLPPTKDEAAKKDPLLDLDVEEREEYLRREEVAKREIEIKKSRVGPTYNKGGPQYWSDGMLDDLKGGGHRRR